MNKPKNTYFVPTTRLLKYESYDHYLMVHANSSKEAYTTTALILNGIAKVKKSEIYETYPFFIDDRKHYTDLPFNEKTKNMIIFDYFINVSARLSFTTSARSDTLEISNTKEDVSMDLYDYMVWGDYNTQIQKLAEKALPEKWSFNQKENDNFILKNYLKYTFNKLQSENKIVETDNYCIFNTGLFSHYYMPIYAYGETNTNNNGPKWFFKGFKDEYELGILDIESKFPERADYFSDPNKLVFNWHYSVHVNYKHILDDLNTSQRLPDVVKNSERPLDLLKGVINTAIQKVTANYKIAVPHYYQNKIQLLIPLSFDKDDTPSVALVLNLMKNGYYQATTCLTLDMAYMDARLIAKPESNWLIADNINDVTETE